MLPLLKKLFFFSTLYFASLQAGAQYTFSIATDLNLLHHFTRNESFTAIGQTVYYQLHFSKKETAYAWVSYHTGGKFKNDLSAVATDSITTPQRLSFTASSRVNFSHISLGWKHYFRGGSNEEQTWGLYTTTGLGILFAHVENNFNKEFDTAHYQLSQPLLKGSATVRRLTLDLGLGTEYALAPSIFLYGELRTWLAASDYPSAYFYNNNVPRVLLLTGGIRILFD